MASNSDSHDYEEWLKRRAPYSPMLEPFTCENTPSMEQAGCGYSKPLKLTPEQAEVIKKHELENKENWEKQQREHKLKVKEERELRQKKELEKFEKKHPAYVGLACKVIVGTLTRTLSQRMKRLTDQIDIDQKLLHTVYATLGVSPDGNGALSYKGVEAMGDATTRAEVKAVLDGLVKAMERHREEAESITEDTAFLNRMTKKVIELEQTGEDEDSELESCLDKLTM